jgi:hypothetical protein
MNEIRRRDQEADEIARIRAIVGRHALPDFVEGFHLRFGLDPADEPGVWIVFHTRGDLPAHQSEADRWIAEMNRLASVVREDILESGEERFPYFRFEPTATIPEADG